MGKLIFVHGVMDSGKSALLCQKHHHFKNKGNRVMVMKSAMDERGASDLISSRVGLSVRCWVLGVSESPYKTLGMHAQSSGSYPDIILVDEAQFLNAVQVEDLARIAHDEDVLVMAFGLKCDFEGKLFEGTQHLFALANRCDELAAMCECGRKATMHIRLTEQKEQIVCGDMDIYKSVCTKCFLDHKDGE
ncbi:thymidine kinase [Vibrio phage 3.058.O._10N.286.46.B8]|nr:thymidine kinase [Vibrio phage 2.058.O._10N.286.46.B8]AUS03151.1 thymidine kinase [Vibrio phage 3.058.O._10N.286.46.B8]